MLSKKKDIWIVISLCVLAFYIIFMIYPLGILFKNAVIENNGNFTFAYFSKFLRKNYYFSTIFNSFKVSLAATALTLIIGTPLAYFYNMYKIKGKTFLQIIIILCSMSAPFIGAYSWILLLGRNGLITNTLKNLTGFNVPSIYGFGGILLVLCMQLYPLVFLYVSGALRNIDNSLLEASENMGCTGTKRFFKIIIPLCIPTILAAALMVFMRAFADFGTPLFIGEGYRTFPVEIYNQFMNETGSDKNFASAVSIIAIIITSLIFLLQRYINGKYKFTMNALHPIEAKEIKGIKELKILASFTDKRLEGFEDVPTLTESGYPVLFGSARAIVAPKGTPKEIIQKLHDVFKQALESPENIEKSKNANLPLDYMSPEELGQYIKDQEKYIIEVKPTLGI